MVFQAGGEVKEVKPFQVGGEVVRQQTEPNAPPLSNDEQAHLVEQLRGELPLPKEKQMRVFQQTVGDIQQASGTARQLMERQRAYDKLIQSGSTPEQIKLILQTQKKLGAPRMGRMAGGIGGALLTTAIAGRFIPGPIDDAGIIAALIAGGGAGLGGGAGEAIQTGLEEKRLIGKQEFLKAFGTEALYELGGRGVVMGGKALFSPFIKQTIPEAASLIDDWAKLGGIYSPSELDRRFSHRVAEAFSRGGFGAEQIWREFEEKQGKTAVAYATSIIDDIAKNVSNRPIKELGEEFAKGITRPNGRTFKLMDDLFEPLYGQLDDLTKSSIVKQTAKISVPTTILDETGRPFEKMVTKVVGERIKGTGVSTKSLKAFRRKIIAKNQRLVAFGKRTGKEMPLASPAGIKMLDDINNLPEVVGHADYRAFRTKILKETRKLNRDVDVSESMVKEISTITRSELLSPDSVAGASKEAKRLHANISRLYAKTQEALETTLSEKVAKRLVKNPTSVIKELFPNKNPEAIRLLRESLVEPISGKPSREGIVLWEQLRRAWLAEAVDETTKGGVINPRVYNNILRKLTPEGFKEMFPESSVRTSVNKIQTLFNTAGKGPPKGVSLFARGAQVAGLGLMYKGAKDGDFVGFTAGSALALGPYAFAKLATNPTGVKLLTAGFKVKPGATELVPLTARMIKLLTEIDRKETRVRFKAQKIRRQERTAQTMPKLQELRGFGGRGF